MAEQDWSPVPLPRPEVIQVPGAVGLAIAVAMGVAAFFTDVRRYRFGWEAAGALLRNGRHWRRGCCRCWPLSPPEIGT